MEFEHYWNVLKTRLEGKGLTPDQTKVVRAMCETAWGEAQAIMLGRCCTKLWGRARSLNTEGRATEAAAVRGMISSLSEMTP
jgi:hypothetical protein